MAGVGLRSEPEFDKDQQKGKPEQYSFDRAKRNLGKDIHDMQVDASADRSAKAKPVEITPQVAKKTRTEGEKAAAVAAGDAAANLVPQNIPISTPKERRETTSAGSAPLTNTNPGPRRGRSRERSMVRAGRTAPVSASVAA